MSQNVAIVIAFHIAEPHRHRHPILTLANSCKLHAKERTTTTEEVFVNGSTVFTINEIGHVKSNQYT